MDIDILDNLFFMNRQRLLASRSIDRYLSDITFWQQWIVATPDQQQELVRAIEKCDITTLKNWRVDTTKNLIELSYRELRDIARVLRIVNYSRLTRAELILSIEGVNNENKAEPDNRNE